MAYKLKCKEDGTCFFFHTLEDVSKFLYVFKDHWCNISWEEPCEIDLKDIPYEKNEKRKNISKDPKQRAKSSLSWGFSLENSMALV